MPGMDGVELARSARAVVPTLPIVFMSGYSDTRVEGIPGAATHVVGKPFTQDEVAKVLEAALGRS